MRLFLIFASILTLSIALGSTLMAIVTIGDATATVDTSVSSTIDEGMGAVQGYVTLKINVQGDGPLHEEIAAVKGLSS